MGERAGGKKEAAEPALAASHFWEVGPTSFVCLRDHVGRQVQSQHHELESQTQSMFSVPVIPRFE